MIVNPERITRAEFEAILWEHSNQLANSDYRVRKAAADAIMRAFDRTERPRRRHVRTTVNVKFVADLARQYAQVEHQDYPHVTADRRNALYAAVTGADPEEASR